MAASWVYPFICARFINEDKSLLFTPMVSVEEEQGGQFGATVLGMESDLAAGGESKDEAANAAVGLFMTMVDAALKANVAIPLKHSILRGSRKDVGRQFSALKEMFARALEEPRGEWQSAMASVSPPEYSREPEAIGA